MPSRVLNIPLSITCKSTKHAKANKAGSRAGVVHLLGHWLAQCPGCPHLKHSLPVRPLPSLDGIVPLLPWAALLLLPLLYALLLLGPAFGHCAAQWPDCWHL